MPSMIPLPSHTSHSPSLFLCISYPILSSAAIGGGDAASYLDMMFDDFDMGGGIGGGGGTSVSSGILSSSQQQQMQSRLARPSSSIDFIQVRDDHRLASSIGVAAADGEPNEVKTIGISIFECWCGTLLRKRVYSNLLSPLSIS